MKFLKATILTNEGKLESFVFLSKGKSSLKAEIEKHGVENQEYGHKVLKIEESSKEDFSLFTRIDKELRNFNQVPINPSRKGR